MKSKTKKKTKSVRTLPLPSLTTSDILTDCLKGVNEPELHGRLSAILPTLSASAVQYDAQARANSLHTVPRVTSVGAVAKDELTDLYSVHMSKTAGAARTAYDDLRNSAPNKRCPLCGVGTVTTLDHHLPKSKYPDLSVVPQNLIPACDYCNNAKRARFPKTAEQQTLHPYYDDFSQEQWVFADVLAGPPVALIYRVTPPAAWPSVDRKRVERHFAVCKLANLFTSNANDDLSTLKAQLANLHATKGYAGVQGHLRGEAERYSRRLNSWQHAMYQALAGSIWFVNGGFNHIAD